MRPFKIGVMSDCFRIGPIDGVRKAAELGADGIQVYTVRGRMSPEQMDAAARAEFKALCRTCGLAISALCGDVGGGFHDPAENPDKVRRSKAIVDLAVDLGADVVTTHIGVVSQDARSATYRTLLAVCRELAEYAAEQGVTFAIETGPEPAATLKRFLDDVGSEGLGANLDPANLVMVLAEDPVQAVYTLADYIVHTHAKDGVQLRAVDPMEVYHGAAPPEQAPGFKEMPLGQGAVDWDAYLNALEEVGYTGYLTIEREVGDDPAADIAAAISFLRNKIA
jgi:sugar phosphate isomerase/epimerase